jgi:hypothetical protein
MPTLTAPPGPDKPKLLGQMRELTRRKDYSTARPFISANHVRKHSRVHSRGCELSTSFRMTRPIEGLSLVRSDLAFVTFLTL